MGERYKLKEVFSRGMPTVTYVRREQLGLDLDLQRAVDKGHAIIAVTGPSKCGKTVLRRTVIPDNAVVHIEGGQVSSEDDFWETVRDHLGAAASRLETASKSVGGTAGLGGSLSLGPARMEAKISESDGSTRSETRTFTGPQKGRLLKQVREQGDVLVVDDFHYIEKDIRSRIVRSMKAAVFDGLTVVMLSVPYRAFDVLSAESEMEGRFTHLAIPAWEVDDLLKIAAKGFPAMGLKISDKVQRCLAEESLGSPLLMQSLCAELCSQHGVGATEHPIRDLDVDDADLPKLFKSVA